MKYLACMIMALFLTLFAAFNPSPAPALTEPGQEMPEFTLPEAISGDEHKLNELIEGKTALVLYWSITCSHCRDEIPVLLEMVKKLPQESFVLLTISADTMEMSDAVAAFARDQGLPGPYLMDVGEDNAMPFGDGLKVVMTPAVFVVGPDGKFIFAHEARADMKELEEVIRESLK